MLGFSTYGYFCTTLIVVALAIFLTIAPIPQVLIWVWPQWLLIIVVYLVFSRPAKYGIYFAFCMGLLADVMIGNHLGLHALTYTVFAYFLSKMNQRIAFFHTIQQALVFFGLFAVDRFVGWFISGLNLSYFFVGYLVLSSLVSLAVFFLIMKIFGSRTQLLKIVR